MAKHIHIFLMLLLFSPIATLVHIQAQNTNLPVGSIPGTAGVSTLGAATYTIPIEVVPGTQGMQPALNISYNSAGGTGILGAQCFLAGLSSISRTGQTDFHDDNITPISLKYNDRFSIDGNRLVNSDTSSYGHNGTVYYKEFHDYSKIVSYGTAGYGPQYFKVFTDNGQVLEYGNSTDSRQTLGNGSTVLNWLLSKVTDLNGNYMTYTYGKSGNEIWINRIDYTGNVAAGLSPYARVVFEYDTGLHVGSVFVAGYEIRQTRLLRAISVLYDNGGGYELVRQYRLTYSLDYPKKLTSVQLMAADSSVLNPTVFQWNSIGVEDVDITNFLTQNISNVAAHFAIDYNQDGVCDIVEISDYNNYWQVFLKQDNGFSLYDTTYNVASDWMISKCIPADLDGDGYSEIITACEQRDNPFCYVTATRYPFQTDTVISVFYTPGIQSLHTGDFLGNGKHQILLQYYNSGSTTSIKFCGPNGVVTQNIPGGTIHLMDFDGDGQQEFMVVTTHIDIYKFDKEGNAFLKIRTINITGTKTVGDFNGDGITDILYRQNSMFKVALGTGNGYNTSAQTILTISQATYTDDLPLVAVDLNHDGYDDIITLKYYNNSGLKVFNYICSGYNNNMITFYNSIANVPFLLNEAEYVSDHSIVFGDFNNDHRIDIVAFKTVSPTTRGFVLYEFDVDKRKPFVQKITKGDGSFVRWNYQDIDGLFYRYSTNISTLPFHFDVVNNIVKTQGNTTDTAIYRYSFFNPAYSFKRKQVMGFVKTVFKDVMLNKVDTTYYANLRNEQQGNYQDFFMPLYVNSLIDGQLTSRTRYELQCLIWNPHRIIPFVSSDTVENFIDSTVSIGVHFIHPLYYRIYSSLNDTYAIGKNGFLTRQIMECSYNTKTLSNGATVTYVDSSTTETRLRGSNLATISTTSMSCDNNGRLSTKSSTADGVTVTKTVNTYDSFGNAISITTSGTGCASRTSTSLFDNTGRFTIRHTNPKGHIFQKNHDPKTGLILSETDENNLTTTYVYDVFGRLDSIRYPDNTFTSCSRHWYNGTTIPKARWYTLTKHTGKANTEEYFDLMGRTVCVVNNSYYSDTRYNLKGQVDRTSAPYGANTPDVNKTWHSYQYDAYGRVIHETAPYTDITYSYGTRNTTVTDNLRGTSSSKTLDAAGRLVQASDPGGTIQYTYTFDTYNGKTVLKTNVTTGGNTTTIIADQHGNRLRISDPDAGIVTYTYNAFGEPISQTDARGNSSTQTYDVLGRVVGKTISDTSGVMRTITYTYDQHSSSNKGKGKLSQIHLDGNLSESFTYDNMGRLYQRTKYIDTSSYTESYTYNAKGQTASLTYPSGYTVGFEYKYNGFLENVRQAANSKLLYKVYSYNKFGQPTRCGYGNDLASDLVYNTNGLLERILTGNKHDINPIKPFMTDGFEVDGLLDPTEPDETLFDIDSTVQNLRYTYDNMGRLAQRTHNSQYEAFNYDNLDRLTSFVQGNGSSRPMTFTTTYDAQGNILSNTMAGTYGYESGKPHAVTEVTPSTYYPDAISPADCETDYNVFNQPSRIAEGDVEILLEYGADGQRVKAVFKNRGRTMYTRYYISANYEKEVDDTGVTTHYNYIYGATGLAAICVRQNGVDSLYYVHPDRLGSYTHITNVGKQVIRSLHFDPWGNVKNDADWSTFASATLSGTLAGSIRFLRGFTGHEHYADLKVINMNGRLYDPVIARFFSPDNFVQVPDFTQSYNRYSYCLNNPLQYVDPNGESFLAEFLYSVCNFLTLPARVTTEGVSWFNDHINGNVKADGYFHSDYLFNAAPPHSIDYQNVINLQNPYTATFYEPDMMTDADGTTYRTEYYWAAVGSGGKYHFNLGDEEIKGRVGNYHELIRWYTREVPVESDFSPSLFSTSSFSPEAIVSLNVFAMANGAKTNLIETAVRYNYKSANSWWSFQHLRPKQKAFRYNQTLGKTGVKYLKGYKGLGIGVAVLSAGMEAINYHSYYQQNGFDWKVTTKFGLDMIMTGVGFLGPVGLTVSSIYFILDVTTDGFGGFGNMY